jgi:hypothetical protein
MAKAKSDVRPKFTVVRDSEGRCPKVKFSKSPIDRATRKRALQTIFHELKATTFRQRRTVWRRLHTPFNSYVALTEKPPTTTAQDNRWRKNAHTYSSKLADLFSSAGVHSVNFALYGFFGDEKNAGLVENEPFEVEEFEIFIERLRMIEEAAAERLDGRPGRPENLQLKLATQTIVIALDDLYVAATGKPGRAGRRNDHYRSSAEQGKPSGPFFRLVKAALTLVGSKQGDEAIFMAIKNHKTRRGRRLLTHNMIGLPDAE